MSSTHTRGPWRAHRGKKTIGIYEPTGVAVGYVHTSQYTEARKAADAALIAAAPEMYEVIRQVVERSTAAGGMAVDDETIVEMAHAALAKAEGR